MQAVQLTLFDVEETRIKKTPPRGGSNNPIVFRDYESYIAKFQSKDHEKTTDDTYTPQDVYEAVLKYVDSIYPLEGKQILRPFYPGGDYEKAEYPEDGVVIDNPPFSIFTKICKFYSHNDIPFFLFGPGLTILSIAKFCSAVIISKQIKFDNGAVVKCNFATNLIGDKIATTAKYLDRLLSLCKSQYTPPKLPKFEYPHNLVSVSNLQSACNSSGDDVYILRSDCRPVDKLDSKDLFGTHLLVADKVADKVAGKVAVYLSHRELNIIKQLNNNT